MSRIVPWTLALGIGGLLTACPAAYYLHQRSAYRAFRVVTPDVLYRSGQLSREGLDYVCTVHGIRTVVSLREPPRSHGDDIKSWEEAYCQARGIKYVSLPVSGAWTDARQLPPVAAAARRFIDLIRRPVEYPPPILVHCRAGRHRTGAMCAIYRQEIDGWSPAASFEEMVRCGGEEDPFGGDLKRFVFEYQTIWKHWPPSRQSSRASNLFDRSHTP